MNKYICPRCSSENVQRLSLIHESGLSEIKTTTFGAGSDGIWGALGGATTKGTVQTAASNRTAPPRKMEFFWSLFFIFILFVVAFIGLAAIFQGNEILIFLLFLIMAVLWFIVSIRYIKQAIRYNTKVWPTRKQKWDNSYMCKRCGNIFQIQL